MKTIFKIIVVALVSVLLCSGQSVEPDRKKRADEAYRARMEYVKSKEYNPYGTEGRDALAKINGLYKKQDLKGVIAAVDEGLKAEPFNIRLLMTKATAYRELKEEAKADQVRLQWMAIADSIIKNGDGHSYKTAWTVISVDEEYAVLDLLGCKVEQQLLQGNEGSQYDTLNVKHVKSGKSLTLYFNIDAPMQHLNKQLAASETPKDK